MKEKKSYQEKMSGNERTQPSPLRPPWEAVQQQDTGLLAELLITLPLARA